MDDNKNDQNSSKKKTDLKRIIAPIAIISFVIILGVVILFLLQNRSSNPKQ